MKVSQATNYFVEYQRMNCKKNTIKTYQHVLSRFGSDFGNRELDSITPDEILSFSVDNSTLSVGLIGQAAGNGH